MNAEACERWSVVEGIEWPAADICFSYEAPSVAVARLRFSNTVGGPRHDLMLRFSAVVAVRYESESFGLIALPNPPALSAGKWSGYTYPLLEVRNSLWLSEHYARNPVAVARHGHFALVSMNDLLHIIALSHVHASWVEPQA